MLMRVRGSCATLDGSEGTESLPARAARQGAGGWRPARPSAPEQGCSVHPAGAESRHAMAQSPCRARLTAQGGDSAGWGQPRLLFDPLRCRFSEPAGGPRASKQSRLSEAKAVEAPCHARCRLTSQEPQDRSAFPYGDPVCDLRHQAPDSAFGNGFWEAHCRAL